MQIKDCLSPLEMAEIQKFILNPTMKEAVKKCILFSVYYKGTLIPDKQSDPMSNFAMTIVAGASGGEERTDEQIGRRLRASFEGAAFVQAGFDDIEKLKIKEEIKKPEKNPAI